MSAEEASGTGESAAIDYSSTGLLAVALRAAVFFAGVLASGSSAGAFGSISEISFFASASSSAESGPSPGRRRQRG